MTRLRCCVPTPSCLGAPLVRRGNQFRGASGRSNEKIHVKHPPGVESAFPKCDHCFCTFVHVHTHIHKHGSASDPAVRHTPLGVHPLPTARSHSAPRDTVSVLAEKTSIEL